MARVGRKGGYESKVKPHFAEIESWLKDGATEKQAAENLGVGYSTWLKYKADNKEFQELCKKARLTLVSTLRGALVKKALGFTYKETKRYKRRNENGDINEYVEETEKQALPDVAALNLCLKNYDSDNWSNDPQALQIKREELELKKEQIKLNDW